MNAKIKPIPDGFHSLTPYLAVRGAAQAIDFYKHAFGAEERFRMPGMDGKSIAHAEIIIGNSILMLSDEAPQFNKSPQTLNGTSVSMVLYVEDVDTAFKRAVDAGATAIMPVETKFYGERSGFLEDPFGHRWTLMTHVEDLSSEEINKRMAEFCAKMAKTKAE